jgi:hypothetical protein
MSYLGQIGYCVSAGVPGEEPPPPPPEDSRLTPKIGALQHNGYTVLNSESQMDILGRYYWVLFGIAVNTNYAQEGIDYLRGINEDMVISQYMQNWETAGYGINNIVNVSGSTWRVSLDNTTDVANGTTNTGVVSSTMTIAGTANTAFRGNWAASNISTVNGRVSFTITGVVGGTAENPSLGMALGSTQGHVERMKLAANNGWMLRNAAGRVISSGVVPDQKGINYHRTTVANGDGDRWSQVKAQHDYTYLVNPYQPTIGEQLVLFLDNFNFKPRTNVGDWNLDGVADNSSTAAIASACRVGNVDYTEALRDLFPGVRIVGNADTTGTGASSNTLNYTEYNTIVPLDAAVKENVYNGSSTGGEYGRSDNWLTLRTKCNNERQYSRDVTLHALHCRGGPGSTSTAESAAQNRDYRTAVIGLAACLILTGNTMAETSVLVFGPQNHNVVPGAYWHTEFSAPLGDPLDSVQSAPRTGTTSIWVRFFRNGFVAANPNTTTDDFTLTDINSWRPPEHAGKTYRRMSIADNPHETVEANPFNTGAALSGTISLTSHSACVFLVDE